MAVPLASLRNLAALAVLSLVGCRSGEGELCVCASDCRSGLTCVVDDRALAGDACAPGSAGGVCTDQPDEAIQTEQATGLPPDDEHDPNVERTGQDTGPGTGTTSSGTAASTETSSGSDSADTDDTEG